MTFDLRDVLLGSRQDKTNKHFWLCFLMQWSLCLLLAEDVALIGIAYECNYSKASQKVIIMTFNISLIKVNIVFVLFLFSCNTEVM